MLKYSIIYVSNAINENTPIREGQQMPTRHKFYLLYRSNTPIAYVRIYLFYMYLIPQYGKVSKCQLDSTRDARIRALWGAGGGLGALGALGIDRGSIQGRPRIDPGSILDRSWEDPWAPPGPQGKPLGAHWELLGGPRAPKGALRAPRETPKIPKSLPKGSLRAPGGPRGSPWAPRAPPKAPPSPPEHPPGGPKKMF